MEELRMIVEMVAKLPQTALWVLIGFWAYKVMIIGSVYGVIRFVVSKTHDYLVRRKVIPPEVKQIEVRAMLDGLCIGSAVDPLMAQLRRLAGRNVGIKSEYIHNQSVEWLRDAIDEKLERERAIDAGKHRPISP